MMQPQITVRAYLPDDEAFLFSTYLRNLWFSPENTTTLRKPTWMKVMRERLGKILAAPDSVRIAVLRADSSVILGYSFIDGKRRFTYVKKAFRTFPIKEALEAEGEANEAPR